MRIRTLYLLSLLLAVVVPLLQFNGKSQSIQTKFPGWPESFMGRAIEEIPLTQSEVKFAASFPGKMARFNDGRSEIVLRWIAKETRSLHPVADCLKGGGYEVKPAPIMVDEEGKHWGCTEAKRAGNSRLVCERIYDSKGNSWSDVSAWFWAAVMNQTEGPWWSAAIAL